MIWGFSPYFWKATHIRNPKFRTLWTFLSWLDALDRSSKFPSSGWNETLMILVEGLCAFYTFKVFQIFYPKCLPEISNRCNMANWFCMLDKVNFNFTLFHTYFFGRSRGLLVGFWREFFSQRMPGMPGLGNVATSCTIPASWVGCFFSSGVLVTGCHTKSSNNNLT